MEVLSFGSANRFKIEKVFYFLTVYKIDDGSGFGFGSGDGYEDNNHFENLGFPMKRNLFHNNKSDNNGYGCGTGSGIGNDDGTGKCY